MKDYYKDFTGWLEFLEGKPKRRLAHKTFVVYDELNDSIYIQYWGSILVIIKRDSLFFTCAGYRSDTTKRRLNQCSPPGFSIFQKDYVWFAKDRNHDIIEFKGFIQIDNLGNFI